MSHSIESALETLLRLRDAATHAIHYLESGLPLKDTPVSYMLSCPGGVYREDQFAVGNFLVTDLNHSAVNGKHYCDCGDATAHAFHEAERQAQEITNSDLRAMCLVILGGLYAQSRLLKDHIDTAIDRVRKSEITANPFQNEPRH